MIYPGDEFLSEKNSKKKRQDAKEVPKFADDIDKALHEIKLIEEKDRCRKERSASASCEPFF